MTAAFASCLAFIAPLRQGAAGVAAMLCLSFACAAQSFFNVGVTPANPTAADQLVATIGRFGPDFLAGRGSVTNLGASIEVVFYERNCGVFISPPPPSESTLPLGRLKAGSYQVRIFLQGACLAEGIVTASGPITLVQSVALYTIDGVSGAKNITRQVF